MARQKSGDGLAASAFGLDFRDAKSARATGDEQTVTVGMQHLPWNGFDCFVRTGESGVDLEDNRGPGDFGSAKGARPRLEGAESSPKDMGRQGPVDAAIFTGDLAGVGDAVNRLGNGGETSSDPIGQVVYNQRSTQDGEPIMKDLSIVVIVDGGLDGGDYRSRIEARFHLHETDPGFLIAFGNGPLDGGCAAPAWEKRRVNVETAVSGDVEDLAGQDLSVCSHNNDIRSQGLEGIDEGGVAGTEGLKDRDAADECLGLDRRWGQLEMTSDWPVGLGNNGDDGEIRVGSDPGKDGTGEFRGAHEHDPDGR